MAHTAAVKKSCPTFDKYETPRASSTFASHGRAFRALREIQVWYTGDRKVILTVLE